MKELLILLILILTGVLGDGGSRNCGNLIAKDGYRYDLTSLQLGINQGTYTSLNGSVYNFQFTVCTDLPAPCGSCDIAGICQTPGNACNGQFDINYVDPLLYGIGIQLRYYGGDRGQGYWPRTTYLTIYCNPSSPSLTDIQINGEEPMFAIRAKSSYGCPARGSYPPSLPFQYYFKKYIYTTNPLQGTIQSPFVLDTKLQWKRDQDVYLNSMDTVQQYIFPRDYDQYHNLSCYYISTSDLAEPFELPRNSTFQGTTATSIWDPINNNFQNVVTDMWQFFQDGSCRIQYWFLSGKAIPVQQIDCNGRTTIFYDFKLGQPDGSFFEVPDKCYVFQTCGVGWNTCKDPYCCNVAQTACVPCGSIGEDIISVGSEN